MFRASIAQTPFTTNVANDFFTNIVGGYFNSDCSFLSTLRALLSPRIKDGDSITLYFGSSDYSARRVEEATDRWVVSSICGGYNISNPGQIIVHNLRSDQASNMANLKAIEAKFMSVYEGYHRLEKVKEFYRKAFAIDCYINPDLKSVIVFVDGLDNKKMHYLQVSILAMLPWYFDPKEGLTDDEMALVYSLRETSPDKYNQCLMRLSSRYDFRSAQIKKLLAGFETKYEKIECDNVRNTIADIEQKIKGMNDAIGDQFRLRNEKCAYLSGLEQKIAEGASDSEIMEYFLCNNHLVLDDVTQTDVYFSVKDYLEYFDSEMAERTIKNRRSFVYNRYEPSSHPDMANRVERLMMEIFVNDNPRLKIRICAAYRFSINGNVAPLSEHSFGFEFNYHLPNPHIDEYRCMGGYETTINTLLMKRDYIGAIEQCIASCKSLNWGDSMVMGRFMSQFWGGRDRFIELPDGTVVGPEDAINWLEQQDKLLDTEVAPDEEKEEETQDEQTY